MHQHAQRLMRQRGEPVPWEEVVRDWYAHVYRPVVETIRRLGLLKDFPERTEADLYVWLLKHRKDLEQRLGWDIRPEAAAQSLLRMRRPSVQHLTEARRPMAAAEEALLFREILVGLPVASEEARTRALEQALVLAQGEGQGARLVALVVRVQEVGDDQVQTIREDVARWCRCNTPLQSVLSGRDGVRAFANWSACAPVPSWPFPRPPLCVACSWAMTAVLARERPCIARPTGWPKFRAPWP